MRKDILRALLIAILALPTTLWADMFPCYTVDAMCDKADVVIEGTVSTINDEGQCGSCGLFWFDDLTCYGYTQVINPGPYVLVSSKHAPWRIPKTIADLRTDIETGLANSREWRRSLAIENPAEKARALARYLLKCTSPKGDKRTYVDAVRRPMAALGKDAVPALIQVLRTAPPGAKVNPAVLILYDIGPQAAPAVPDLIALLDEPEHASTGYVLSALGSTADPRAVPYLEKYLGSEDERLARDAGEALAMHRKRRLKPAQEDEQRNAKQEISSDKK